MSLLLIPIGSIVCLNKLSKFAGLAKSVVGLEPRPCDTEAFGRNTAPIRIGHDDNRAKSDIKLASNRHMAFVIDCAEFASGTLKAPGHIDNPVRLIFSILELASHVSITLRSC